MKNINKILKILIKKNVRIATKFPFYLIKNIKHFSQSKKLCPKS